MARKTTTKAAPAASPLLGCNVAISGTFAGTTQTAIQGQIESLGAEFSKSVTSDTTHLITTQKDFDKVSVKVKTALANSIPIVSLVWLRDSESSGIKADETQYSYTTAATSAAPSQPKMAIKRPVSPDPVASPPATGPATKKLKVPDTKASNAKVGDGYNAKSATLHVPLDEYCPQPAYQVHIGSDGTIYDASLNQTNASNNNNKFYRIQVCYVSR